MMHIIRRRKSKPMLLQTQEIFNLPHYIDMVWGELAFIDGLRYTQRGNGLQHSWMLWQSLGFEHLSLGSPTQNLNQLSYFPTSESVFRWTGWIKGSAQKWSKHSTTMLHIPCMALFLNIIETSICTRLYDIMEIFIMKWKDMVVVCTDLCKYYNIISGKDKMCPQRLTKFSTPGDTWRHLYMLV